MTEHESWWRSDHGAVAIRVYVQPGAKRTEIVGVHGEELRIRVAARPIEGATNKELVEMLAKLARVPKGSVTIERGGHSRHKVVQILTDDPHAVAERINIQSTG